MEHFLLELAEFKSIKMKNIFIGIIGLFVIGFCFSSFTKGKQEQECTCDKDKMVVVMRFEIKVLPDKVAFLKQSWDECRAQVLAKEPGCMDYSLFQSYKDSTLFCLTEAWATKGDHNAHMQLEHTKKYLELTRGINDPSFKSATNYIYWVCPGANGNR